MHAPSRITNQCWVTDAALFHLNKKFGLRGGNMNKVRMAAKNRIVALLEDYEKKDFSYDRAERLAHNITDVEEEMIL